MKSVSLVLGYPRLVFKIDAALRGHLRAAIRRRIIETDGPTLVRAGTATMADYEPDELLEVFRSVMRKGTRYDREEVIPTLAHHLGFVRLTDTIRDPIRKAITRAIRARPPRLRGERHLERIRDSMPKKKPRQPPKVGTVFEKSFKGKVCRLTVLRTGEGIRFQARRQDL